MAGVELALEIDRLQRQSTRNHAPQSLPKSRPSAKPTPPAQRIYCHRRLFRWEGGHWLGELCDKH